jgi:hypothetical protein
MRTCFLKCMELDPFILENWIRGRLDPFILENWNLLNKVTYLASNVSFHHFPNFRFKPTLNSYGVKDEK